MAGSPGCSRRSHCAICCGDQSSSSFGRDQPRQLDIAGQLAHLRTSRPVKCSSIGSQRAVRVTATIASDLPRHRRRWPAETISDRSRGQACCDPPGNFFTFDQRQMIGPPSPRNGGIPPDWRRNRRMRGSVSPSVRSISRIDSPRRHIAHNKFCCSTLNLTGPTPIPASTQHIIELPAVMH